MTRPATSHSRIPAAIWAGVILVVIASQASGAQARPSGGKLGKSQARHAARRKDAAGSDLVSPPLPLFLPPLTVDLGTYDASSVAVADLNHDGRLDLVFAAVNGVNVLLGNGDGTTQAAVVYDSGGLFPRAVAVADVNHDSKPDILVIDQCGKDDGSCTQPTVGVLLGNGNGTFQPVVIYSPGGFGPTSIVVADVNGDGNPDLVVSDCNLTGSTECNTYQTGVLAVLLGNGDGTFQTVVTYGSGGYSVNSVAVADVNGDHKLDLVATNNCAQPCLFTGEGAVSVLLGNGDGTFQPAVNYDPGASTSLQTAVADLNHDGKLDLAVVNCVLPSQSVCGVGTGVVSILLGNGDGTFQSPVTYVMAPNVTAWSLAVADVDGDGKPDIALADLGNDVLQGNGDGTFQPPVNSGTGVYTSTIGVADMNGDGKPDLVTSTSCNSSCFSLAAILLHVGNVSTSTSLTSSPNPAVFGQETLTATVSSGSGPPTGTVAFYVETPGNTYAVGSATLSGGVATLAGTNTGFGLGTGTNTVAAVYQGSLKYQPSLSPVIQQVITQAMTTTTSGSSSNPGVVPKLITYTVNVVGQYGGAVTGNVSCQDNGTNLIPVRGHPLQFQKKYTTAGTHTIACSFNGDGDNLPSSAPPLTEKIVYPTATSLKTSGSPSHVGQPVTYTATVTSKYAAVPNGEIVAFTYGKKVLGTAPLAGGVAALTTAALPTGTRTVKANYPGDTTLNTSTGKVTQVVEP